MKSSSVFKLSALMVAMASSADMVKIDLDDVSRCSMEGQGNTKVLTCKNAVQSESAYIAYNSNSTECSENVYPSFLSRISGEYVDINDGQLFGDSTHTSVLVNLNVNSFGTYANFGTDRVNFRRRIVFEDTPTNYNHFDLGTYSVSHCPGDFTQNAQCRGQVHSATTLRFSTNPADQNNSTYCYLERGVMYYINFVTTPDPYGIIPYCRNTSHDECAMFYTESALKESEDDSFK